MARWFLAVCAVLLAIGAAQGGESAMPPGTRLIYDNFQCEVVRRDSVGMTCAVAGGELALVGNLFNVGGLPEVGYLRALASLKAGDSTDRKVVEIAIAEADLTRLRELWPLEVGKSTAYGYELFGQLGRTGALALGSVAAKAKTSVLRREDVKIGETTYDTLVVEEVAMVSPIEPGVAPGQLLRRWWYAPELGVFIRAETGWTAGPNAGNRSASELREILYPETAVAAVAEPELEPVGEIYVALRSATVRIEPRLSAAGVATIKPGESIWVVGKVKGETWYRVGAAESPLGYVVAAQLAPASGYAAALAAEQAAVVSEADETALRMSQPKSGVVVVTAVTAPTPDASSSAFAGVDFGRYHALVIGNDAYSALPPLATAAGDADAVAAILGGEYGFEVTLLRDASRRDILGALAAYRKRLTWDDNLLIYYAGHGWLDEATELGYWLPTDAEEDNPANWISNADVTAMLKAIQAKHIMVVADSCYSGSLSREARLELRDADYLRRIVRKRARTVLTSGGMEPVTDSGGGSHSVFAKAFLDALAENTGALDGQALFSRVREPVVLNSPQTPEYANIRIAGHDGGDFVFVRRPAN